MPWSDNLLPNPMPSIGPIHIFQHNNNTNAAATPFRYNVVVRYEVLNRLSIFSFVLCVELEKVPREEVVKGRHRKKKTGRLLTFRI